MRNVLLIVLVCVMVAAGVFYWRTNPPASSTAVEANAGAQPNGSSASELRKPAEAQIPSVPAKATAQEREQQASSGRIVNGEKADLIDYPWIAAIGAANGNQPPSVYCGGTLIDRRWVLTAAHCKVLAGDIVILGRGDLSKRAVGVEVRISRVLPNPDYDSRTLDHDVALLELESDQTIAPLALVDARGVAMARSSKFRIAGWGQLGETRFDRPNELQQVVVGLTDQADCVSKYAGINKTVTALMFCAQGKKPNGDISDACQGDSGGPLVAEDTSVKAKVLGGIISKGEGCGRKDFPGIYTRLSLLRDWVDKCKANPEDTSCHVHS